jgi:YebC/PmpR family DNA-binding regulatory protein
MAGHSKWAKVKTFKGAIDAKRSKMFAKLSKEVFVAARLGGGDPELNPRLRTALIKCRIASMPKDNIDRAIKRATGGDDKTIFEDLTYEIYAPNGVAVLAELSTDNRNRTAAEIRSICSKNGGSIASAGSVTRLFQRMGQIFVARDSGVEDAVMEVALEAGAEDFKSEPEGYEILTDPNRFEAVHKALETAGMICESAEVSQIPSLTVPLSGKEAEQVQHFLELIEDHDDVKSAWSNADYTAS